MHTSDRRKIALFIIVILIPVFLLVLPFSISSKFRAGLSIALSPSMKLINYFYQKGQNLVENWSDLSNLADREKSQREELERLTWEVFRLREISAEYERLRKIIKYKDNYNQTMVPSRVIGRDPSMWNQILIIDKGIDAGIKLGMPVVVSLGAIGKISRVADKTAEVLLLTDIRSRVGALVQRTRGFGVVRGDNSGGFILEYLSRNAEIELGDIVMTSGLGDIFPKGLILGKVSKIKKLSSDLSKSAYVESYVNFGRLEDVLVILKEQEWVK